VENQHHQSATGSGRHENPENSTESETREKDGSHLASRDDIDVAEESGTEREGKDQQP
jgi:hypothetical protein